MFDLIATLTWRHPKKVLVTIVAFTLVAGFYARDVEEHLEAAGFTDPTSESERALELLRDELGYDANPGLIVLLRDPAGARIDLTSPGVRNEVSRLERRLAGTKFVGRAINPLRPLERIETELGEAAALDPTGTLAAQAGRRLDRAAAKLRNESPLIADDGRSIVLTGHLATQDVEEDGGAADEDAKRRLASKRFELGVGGFAPSFNEVNDQTREDLTKAELIAFPILAVLLLLVFRGVIAAAIPLLIGLVSILGSLLGLRVMAEFTDTSLFALNITTALSLGLSVDYALLMISRYREELARHGPSPKAHRRTVVTSGRTVVFSGLTVAAAMAALVVFPQRFLYSVGVAGATVAVLASVIALFAVPSLLAVLGDRINALSVRRGPAMSDTSDAWYRLSHWVMRHPLAVALAATALLLAPAAAISGIKLTGPSAEAVPPTQPSYEVNTYIEDNYPRLVTEAITVTVSGDVGPKQLAELRQRTTGTDGIGIGTKFERASRDLAYANFSPVEKALEERTQDAVREIRERGGPAGSELLVSGNTARFIDQKESLASHTPLVVALITLTTFVLLFMLTGSVLLPLKTLVMNALTLAATLGLVILAFQEGWLTGLFGYTGPGAVEVTSIVFVFAVTFGLATDYAVLVLARIKENYDAGLGNEEAVAQGIGSTGRVISAAAVMIAVVFIAFSVSAVFFMKQISLAQAAGVLIDATIVRALLVPALMRMLGEWNWWAPAPMKRFQQRFGIREA